ncbi:MAG: ABC transporter permease subunit [Calditrichaeota bacterium]|nr:MAG: ABC transporter permease subunit [Calditrichota bacterium]MBL1204506.1 ABC transporter permease subunit [Calditrichota bacterium]NOG44335.1 ABC transporter permease subunit [Calditrichota bacterium]
MLLFLIVSFSFGQTSIKIGSKKFTESVILGDIANHIAKSNDLSAEHKAELGGTRVLWGALLKGEIDIYPEYSGTMSQEIFSNKKFADLSEMKNHMDSLGIKMVGPLGFNNTYALGLLKKTAEKFQLRKISDLSKYTQLSFGFTNEFMDRGDGWPALQTAYNLPHKNVKGLDHDLAYRALAAGTLDVMDLYSTDAEIKYYDLSILEDDYNHFPEYQAYFLIRKELVDSVPLFVKGLQKLVGKIDEAKMANMNARVKNDKIPSSRVAADFLNKELKLNTEVVEENLWDRLKKTTTEHLILVMISLTLAILISIPLGIIASKIEKGSSIILGIAGIIQTIPSLAILVFMIPLLGIGAKPAMMALFLYSLLPIIRNTYSGIKDIPTHISESAIALGLNRTDRLRFVELPLAARSILAGIKTAAVINIGTATLGALIGAGGYGQPILTGIRLDDTALILEGAIPAALLALLVQGAFDLLEKLLIRH